MMVHRHWSDEAPRAAKVNRATRPRESESKTTAGVTKTPVENATAVQAAARKPGRPKKAVTAE